MFSSSRLRSHQTTLGFAYQLANPALELEIYGSPHEIAEELARLGTSFASFESHPSTSIRARAVRQAAPLLELAGGPGTEAVVDLLEALDRGDEESFEDLLGERAAELGLPAAPLHAPLLRCVVERRVRLVQALLRSLPCADARGDFAMTALHWAAARGDAELVFLLRGAGAEANARSWFCVNPAELACLNGFDRLGRRLDDHATAPSPRDLLERLRDSR